MFFDDGVCKSFGGQNFIFVKTDDDNDNNKTDMIRYDTNTIEEFNVDSKAEYSALSSTRSQKLKQTKTVPL